MRTSKPGETVYLEIGIHYVKAKDHILLSTRDTFSSITTINRDPASKRGHPNLFAKLAKVLEEAGAPHPEVKEAEPDETTVDVAKIMERGRTPPEFRG